MAQHIHYYINGIKNIFQGGNLEIRDKYSFTFTEITSQNEWKVFLSKFWNDTENLAKLIEKFPEEKTRPKFC